MEPKSIAYTRFRHARGGADRTASQRNEFVSGGLYVGGIKWRKGQLVASGLKQFDGREAPKPLQVSSDLRGLHAQLGRWPADEQCGTGGASLKVRPRASE